MEQSACMGPFSINCCLLELDQVENTSENLKIAHINLNFLILKVPFPVR